MIEILDRLTKGDDSILKHFKLIKLKWDEILKDFQWDSPKAVENMRLLVSFHQYDFEDLAHDNWLGQRIMVIVGINQYYSINEGFTEVNERKVRIILEAIESSSCSSEVKQIASEISTLYYIEQEA